MPKTSNLLKIALVPAVIMTVVVGILFILVTNISAMVTVDTPRAAAPLTTMEATLAHCSSASPATSQGGLTEYPRVTAVTFIQEVTVQTPPPCLGYFLP